MVDHILYTVESIVSDSSTLPHVCLYAGKDLNDLFRVDMFFRNDHT